MHQIPTVHEEIPLHHCHAHITHSRNDGWVSLEFHSTFMTVSHTGALTHSLTAAHPTCSSILFLFQKKTFRWKLLQSEITLMSPLQSADLTTTIVWAGFSGCLTFSNSSRDGGSHPLSSPKWNPVIVQACTCLGTTQTKHFYATRVMAQASEWDSNNDDISVFQHALCTRAPSLH